MVTNSDPMKGARVQHVSVTGLQSVCFQPKHLYNFTPGSKAPFTHSRFFATVSL